MKSGTAVQEDGGDNGGGQRREIKEEGVRKFCHKRAATKKRPAQDTGYKY